MYTFWVWFCVVSIVQLCLWINIHQRKDKMIAWITRMYVLDFELQCFELGTIKVSLARIWDLTWYLQGCIHHFFHIFTVSYPIWFCVSKLRTTPKCFARKLMNIYIYIIIYIYLYTHIIIIYIFCAGNLQILSPFQMFSVPGWLWHLKRPCQRNIGSNDIFKVWCFVRFSWILTLVGGCFCCTLSF